MAKSISSCLTPSSNKICEKQPDEVFLQMETTWKDIGAVYEKDSVLPIRSAPTKLTE
jgi:hypothetical protein